MKKNYNIIVADRDRQVRAFLSREMILAGYSVWQVKNGFELLNQLAGKEQMDLLILDPDFPDADEELIFIEVADKCPLLPIIVHAYSLNTCIVASSKNPVIFVEKHGNSIDLLIKNITVILQNNQAG